MKKRILTVDNRKMERRVFKLVFFIAIFMAIINPSLYVNADTTGVEAVTEQINLLELLLASIASSLGNIITLWAIVKFGLAMQGNDGATQAHAFGPFIGGFIMSVSPQVLALFHSA